MRSPFPSLLLLCAVGAVAQQTQPSSPSHRVNQQEPSNHNGDAAQTQSLPSQTVVITNGVPEKKAAAEDKDRRNEPSYWKKVISPEILPNWILAAVGIFGTIAAFLNFWVINKQARDANTGSQRAMELTGELAEAGKETAKATEQNADATRKTVENLMIGQRAWIVVTIGPIADFTPEPNKLEMLWVMPTITNCGQTPARIIRIRGREHQVTREEDLPAKPTYEGEGAIVSKWDGNLLLPPNAAIQPIKIGISASDFIAIWMGKPLLYLYGFVDYLDVYDRPQTTRFCFAYNVPHGFNPNPKGFYIGGPPEYNKAT